MSQTVKSCCKAKRWQCISLTILLYLVIVSFDSFAFIFKHSLTNESSPNIELINSVDQSNPYHTASSIPIYGEHLYCNPTQYETGVIMGLYDTGTNVALQLLESNCFGHKTGERHTQTHFKFKYQFNKAMQSNVETFQNWRYKSFFNYSKHQTSPSLEDTEYATNANHSIHSQIHIVIIKDILTWIKSICKQNYYILPLRLQWFDSSLCPYNISNYNGTASANEWHVKLYKSFVDVWNQFYQSWMRWDHTPSQGGTEFVIEKWRKFNAYSQQKFHGKTALKQKSNSVRQLYQYFLEKEFESLNATEKELFLETQLMRTNLKLPAIVIRFEDLLFHPQQVLDRVCKCVGGYRVNEAVIQSAASKGHGQSRNRSEALKAYSNDLYRYQNYGKKDLEFIERNVNDTIMEFFGYKIESDVEETLVPRFVDPKKKKRFYHSY